MIHLILYDISTDAIRTKIAKRLVAEGYERIQLSVFVGNPHPQSKKALWTQFKAWLKPEPTAQLVVIRVSADQFNQMAAIGKIDFDIDYLLGIKNSIFI